jgi:hypothetical protein
MEALAEEEAAVVVWASQETDSQVVERGLAFWHDWLANREISSAVTAPTDLREAADSERQLEELLLVAQQEALVEGLDWQWAESLQPPPRWQLAPSTNHFLRPIHQRTSHPPPSAGIPCYHPSCTKCMPRAGERSRTLRCDYANGTCSVTDVHSSIKIRLAKSVDTDYVLLVRIVVWPVRVLSPQSINSLAALIDHSARR